MAAYLYGRPPLSVGLAVARFPANEMVSIARLVDPTIRTVVAPNRDTTYTVAHLDLSQGPLVIDVPNTGGRYYVLQLLDAYPTFPPGQTSIGCRAGWTSSIRSGPFCGGIRPRCETPGRCGRSPQLASDLGASRRTDATGAVRAGLEAAPRAGARLVSAAVRRANAYSRGRNNGWLVPQSYIGAYGRKYLGRAVVARFALGANTRAETVYPAAFTDGRGRPLSGGHRYRLRFERGELPPVGAFWSVTMYEGDYLYPNPLRRYAIGDRTRGLRRGRDGSLTLFIQHRAPRGAARSNWLPAPRGRFRLIMRLYEPRRPVLRGAWRPPPLRRRFAIGE